MRPIYEHAGYAAYDLTEGKVHKVTDDGTIRFVVLFPETWEPRGEPVEMETVKGNMVVQLYTILTWSEHKLVLEP